jgi:hypothetical protein
MSIVTNFAGKRTCQTVRSAILVPGQRSFLEIEPDFLKAGLSQTEQTIDLSFEVSAIRHQ